MYAGEMVLNFGFGMHGNQFSLLLAVTWVFPVGTCCASPLAHRKKSLLIGGTLGPGAASGKVTMTKQLRTYLFAYVHTSVDR